MAKREQENFSDVKSKILQRIAEEVAESGHSDPEQNGGASNGNLAELELRFHGVEIVIRVPANESLELDTNLPLQTSAVPPGVDPGQPDPLPQSRLAADYDKGAFEKEGQGYAKADYDKGVYDKRSYEKASFQKASFQKAPYQKGPHGTLYAKSIGYAKFPMQFNKALPFNKVVPYQKAPYVKFSFAKAPAYLKARYSKDPKGPDGVIAYSKGPYAKKIKRDD